MYVSFNLRDSIVVQILILAHLWSVRNTYMPYVNGYIKL